MNQNSELLDNKDVISMIQTSEAKFSAGKTLKIQQLIEEYKRYIYMSKCADNSNAKIFDQSIECEILRQDDRYKGWRKGKIKFVIQFEPETNNEHNQTSLDDIRNQLGNTN